MGGASKVLIVDDEPNVRLVFRTALEAAGYDVTEAADGESALVALQKGRADLVFLDLQMPGMEGLEVLERVRATGDDTPVVIVTAHGDVPDAVKAMRLGAIDFLQKPLTPEALRRVVSEVVERHSVSLPAPVPESPEPTLLAARFADKIARAERALNRREFDEAESYLDQALMLEPRSALAARLLDVLRADRRAHDGPYGALRELFPVGWRL